MWITIYKHKNKPFKKIILFYFIYSQTIQRLPGCGQGEAEINLTTPDK